MLDLVDRQGGQSAVQVNSLMHDCHVTMQVLNRLTQRHLPRDPQHLTQPVLTGIMQMDIQVMREGKGDNTALHSSHWEIISVAQPHR